MIDWIAHVPIQNLGAYAVLCIAIWAGVTWR